MKLPSFPTEYNKFVADILGKAKENQVKVIFKNSEFVYSGADDKFGSAGYFTSDPPELAMSLKNKRIENTMGLLAHESSHMDQYLDNRVEWEKSVLSYSIFYDWVEGEDKYEEHEIATAAEDVINLELDCERRAVDKIKRYNLPIDLVEYKKKANSYLYAIRFFSEIRKYHPKIYAHNEVWRVSPTNFKSNYTKIPSKLLKAYQEYTNNN